MARYRTKVKYIEAVKFTRNNIAEVEEFTNGKVKEFYIPHNIEGQATCKLENNNRVYEVAENKYIIKITNDDFYICSEDSFEAIYEENIEIKYKIGEFAPYKGIIGTIEYSPSISLYCGSLKNIEKQTKYCGRDLIELYENFKEEVETMLSSQSH